MSHYEKHVFFCVNQRTNGKKCCQDADAEDMASYAKQRLRAEGLSGPYKIRVSRSGCLGRCALGPCIVIYPEGIWYSYHSKADIDEIICEHLIRGQVVERLQIQSADEPKV